MKQAESTPSVGKISRRRLFQADGFWYFKRRNSEPPVVISGVIRECRFDAARLRTALDINEKSFYRLVQEGLGVTPNYWLRSERMAHARQLLRDAKTSKEVAILLGFPHLSGFIREFKTWYQVTPGEFRLLEKNRRTSLKYAPKS